MRSKKKKIKPPYRVPIAPPQKNHGDEKKYDRKKQSPLVGEEFEGDEYFEGECGCTYGCVDCASELEQEQIEFNGEEV